MKTWPITLFLSAWLACTPARAATQLARVADLRLPGPAGRFDYAAFDASTGALWLNQMGADRTLVFDPRRGDVVATVTGLAEPTGITIDPRRRLAFVSESRGAAARAGARGWIAVVDLDARTVTAHVAAGVFPDGSAWVSPAGRLFVSDEIGGTESVLGGVPLRAQAEVALGGEAGMSAWDPISGRLLVNVQSRDELVAIDPRALRIVDRRKMPASCDHNHGLLVDAADRLAFVACDGNARLLALSLPDLRPVQPALALGRDPDVLALDRVRHRLVVAAESGVAALFAIGGGRLQPLWRGLVGPDAHVVAVSPGTGLLYFPLRDLNGHPTLRVVRVAPAAGAGAARLSVSRGGRFLVAHVPARLDAIQLRIRDP